MHFTHVCVMLLSSNFAMSTVFVRFILRYVGVDFLAAGILVHGSFSPEVLQLKDSFCQRGVNQVWKVLRYKGK